MTEEVPNPVPPYPIRVPVGLDQLPFEQLPRAIQRRIQRELARRELTGE